MNRIHTDDIFAAIAVLIVLMITAWATYWLLGEVCHRRYAGIGDTRFELVAGCLVEVEPGLWIPDDAYYYKEE